VALSLSDADPSDSKFGENALQRGERDATSICLRAGERPLVNSS